MKKTITSMGLWIGFGLHLIFSAYVSAEVIEFRIANGTDKNPWNTANSPIQARQGDVIRFYNDDMTVHRLHTNGAPCPHGPDIAAGGSWDCIVSQPYSSSASGALYDHYVGPEAQVWIEAIP